MKVHPLNLLIAVLISALLAYGIWSLDANTLKGTTGVGSFVFLASTLACSIGLRFRDGRAGVSVKLLGSLFFVAAFVLNVVLVFTGATQAVYVIICGIAFLLFLLVANGVFSAAQD
jgi:hypothetical protein